MCKTVRIQLVNLFETNLTEKFDLEKKRLRMMRDRILSMHRILMEIQKSIYEVNNPSVTRGQLLELLFTHENFTWLRAISTLVSNIDAALAHREGITIEQVEEFFAEIRTLFDQSEGHASFKENYDRLRETEPGKIPFRIDVLTELGLPDEHGSF